MNAWCQFGISLADNSELLRLLYGHLLAQTDVDGGLTSEILNCLGHLIGQPASSKLHLTFFNVLLPTTVTALGPLINKVRLSCWMRNKMVSQIRWIRF